MLVVEYDGFVRSTDQYAERSPEERERIATYGLVGEIGSLLSAVKKQLLLESGASAWNTPNDEIVEELGDAIWYCFSLSQVLNARRGYNVLRGDISSLRRELSGRSSRHKRIQDGLSERRQRKFLETSNNFPRGRKLTFGAYQEVAYLTARTNGQVLQGVCLAVLWQLSAELLRRKLPESERQINTTIDDRPPNRILEEIAWHLAALASLYGLSLDAVVEANRRKVEFRQNRTQPTPLHDDEYDDPSQQFPRAFSISFVTVGDGRARMYLGGRQLGDELTDNSYEGDGYRFHDVMHLANVAKLGWSPVLRSLLGKKRKRDPKVDEVEDGARAKIVEEAVVKVIHSEGARLAQLRDPDGSQKPWRLFPTHDEVTFRFLKLIHTFVRGLEVDKNRFWEWEDAIVEGYAVFDALCREGQGTVHVNLVERTLRFDPDVYVDMPGTVIGMGSAGVAVEGATGTRRNLEETKVLAVKRAVLEALGMPGDDSHLHELELRLVERGVTVKAFGAVQAEMWRRGVISFRTTINEVGGNVVCTALAISDPRDAVK